MHKPYRGMIDPSYYNYGGQSLMCFEKYNHREYLNKVKAWPLNHMKYLEETQPIYEAKYQPKENDEKVCFVKPKNEILPEGVPHFFRRIHTPTDPKLIATLHQPNQMWPIHKKYREKTSAQYLQYLNPHTDPYGHKESKARTKMERKGLSYASNLMNFSFKEESILKQFDEILKLEQQSGESITISTIEKIVLQLQAQYKIKSIDSFSKLFNHIQKQINIPQEMITKIYEKTLNN